MGRIVDPGRYGEVLSALRERSPEAGLGADIMVGFPEEGDDDFTILRDFLDNSPLTYFHVFPFSARPGTPAAGRRPVRESVVKDRSTRLRRLSAEKNLDFRRSFERRTLDAVAIRKRAEGEEGVDSMSDKSRSARTKSRVELLTGNYIKIFADEDSSLGRPVSERELVSVRVGRVSSERTEGEILR
jgi:threonylcarbamoyladenosine tRNA methylthiotransferase MtaB